MKKLSLFSALLATGLLGEPSSFAMLLGSAEQDVAFSYQSDSCGVPEPIDTGWIDPSVPELQIRLNMHLVCSSDAVLSGKAILEWGDVQQIRFEGTPGAGSCSSSTSLQMEGRLKIAIDSDGFDINWEGPIPLLPELEHLLTASETFDPFLLQGNPDRPLSLDDEIPRFPMVDLGILDFIGVPDDVASLDVTIDMSGRYHVSVAGISIAAGGVGDATTEEGQGIALDSLSGGRLETSATYHATATHQLVIILYISMRVETIGDIFSREINDYEYPMISTEWTETWTFNTESLGFDLPDIALLTMDYRDLNRVEFASVSVGGAETQRFLVVNNGESLLRGSFSTDAPFSVWPEGLNTIELEPAEEFEFQVRFLPEREGTYTGILSIESNDPDEGDLSIPIFATAVAVDEGSADDTEESQDAMSDAVESEEEGSIPEESGCGCRML